jgi:hypothetical protein
VLRKIGWLRNEAKSDNKRFQLTKPLVMRLAFARPAPTDFAAEPNVRETWSYRE